MSANSDSAYIFTLAHLTTSFKFHFFTFKFLNVGSAYASIFILFGRTVVILQKGRKTVIGLKSLDKSFVYSLKYISSPKKKLRYLKVLFKTINYEPLLVSEEETLTVVRTTLFFINKSTKTLGLVFLQLMLVNVEKGSSTQQIPTAIASQNVCLKKEKNVFAN